MRKRWLAIILIISVLLSAGLAACESMSMPTPGEVEGPMPTATKTPIPTIPPTITETNTPTPAPTSSPTPTATPNATATWEAMVSAASPLDVSTFPLEYQAIADDPMSASPELQTEYQQFIEASRWAFFEKEGIKDEVTNMKDIDPALRTLWGMVMWQQLHREEAIAGKQTIVVTPDEWRTMIDKEEPIAYWSDEFISNGRLDWYIFGYNFGGQFQWGFYGPEKAPTVKVFGKDTAIRINGASLDGIEGGLGRIDDNPNNLVDLMMVKNKDTGKFSLVPRIAVFNPSFVLSERTVCIRMSGKEIVLEGEEAEGPVTDILKHPVSPEIIWNALGKAVNIDQFGGGLEWIGKYGIEDDPACLYPSYNVFMAHFFSGGQEKALVYPFFPWVAK